MATQNRVYYATHAAAVAPLGVATYTSAHLIHGAQTITTQTNFNLEDIFEISQSDAYQIFEDLPDVQVTVNKVLDGYPLVYHMATVGAPSASLQGRSNSRGSLAMTIHTDTQENASGTPLSQVTFSGLYVNSLTYSFPVDGNFTEEITLVGNDKVWSYSGFTLSGSATNSQFDGEDRPAYGSVNRRQHFDWDTTRLPTEITGISSSGTNNADSDGNRRCSVQNITVSVDLGRENVNELGKKGPYYRTPQFPVDVTTTIEVMNKSGDGINAYSTRDSLTDQTIILRTAESTKINLGTKNKLNSVSDNGGDTGGGNRTITYTYVAKSTMTVTHSADPTPALQVP